MQADFLADAGDGARHHVPERHVFNSSGSSKTGSQDANRSTIKLRLLSENGRMPCFA